MELDPGGIGKGYAVDRMVDVLKQKGIAIALVAASGSSIYGLGAPPDEPRGWRITIRDPKNERASVAEVFSEERVHVHLRQLREVLSRRRPHLQPHYGPAHRISGAGHAIGFTHHPAHHRQRGVGEAVFHQWPPVGGAT